MLIGYHNNTVSADVEMKTGANGKEREGNNALIVMRGLKWEVCTLLGAACMDETTGFLQAPLLWNFQKNATTQSFERRAA